MTALIDADIIAYRNAASCEKRDKSGAVIALDPVDIAITRADIMMRDILSKEDKYLAFLSGEKCFRYEVFPEYKANRKDKPKPVHLKDVEDFLKFEYNAIVCDGYEADDALGFNQTEDTVIYTIDKDLNMIPGHHFNFITNKYFEVSELDALRFFYKQMLIGDVSDNIKGIEGIGPVKSAKLIDHLENEFDMYNVVQDLYAGSGRFNEVADCLWIWRKKGETFSERMANKSKPTTPRSPY